MAAPAHIARENGKKGGRPKGVLNKATIEKIRTQQAVAKIVEEKAGMIVDNLLRNIQSGDTMAARELFDRAWGKAPQGIILSGKVEFSLRNLSNRRKVIEMGKVDLIDEENNLLEE